MIQCPCLPGTVGEGLTDGVSLLMLICYVYASATCAVSQKNLYAWGIDLGWLIVAHLNLWTCFLVSSMEPVIVQSSLFTARKKVTGEKPLKSLLLCLFELEECLLGKCEYVRGKVLVITCTHGYRQVHFRNMVQHSWNDTGCDRNLSFKMKQMLTFGYIFTCLPKVAVGVVSGPLEGGWGLPTGI